jgi:riboflavin kinase/FMN adenylyltransferase
MDIIRGLQNRLDYPNPVVTIGNFDGVHLGHQKIFRSVVERAKKIKGTPIAITFSPHPVRVLAPEKGLKIITGFEDKAKLISGAGIKVLIGINFDREFARMEPDDFIKNILVDMIGTKWVIVGHNYAFGKAKKGRADLLRRRGRRYGFGVSVVRYAKVYGDIVSSSRVRSLILRGRVCETSRMLGRLYHIEGTVIKGAGRGASLMNIPTANIAATNELIPKEGVYAVRVSFDDNVHNGVANIGSNPTFDGNKMSYEVHIFDFNRNILGEKLRIHFIDRIRDEKKFLGFKELEEQIKKDIEKARFIISKRDDPLYL